MFPSLPLLTILNQAFCKETISGRWAGFSGHIFNLISNSFLVIAVWIGLMTIAWWMPSRYKRLLLTSGLVFLIVYGLASTSIAIALANQAIAWVTPTDSGAPADVIVVLGRGAQQRIPRVEATVQLWREGRAPLIFVSGAWDAPRLAAQLEKRGIPSSVIEGEGCSRTTEENAQFTAALLQPRNLRRIVLVTDSPHMLRSLLTFRSLGFEVTAHPNPLAEGLSRTRQGWMVYREYVGLLSYGVLGRFSPRSPVDPQKILDVTLTSKPLHPATRINGFGVADRSDAMKRGGAPSTPPLFIASSDSLVPRILTMSRN